MVMKVSLFAVSLSQRSSCEAFTTVPGAPNKNIKEKDLKCCILTSHIDLWPLAVNLHGRKY